MHTTRLRISLFTALFTALLIAGAYIRIPLPLVPFTLQTLFLLVGALMIRKWMLLSICAYLLLGALGLQVFANGGGGFAYFAGPTGGFLIGFLPAVALIAWLSSAPWKYFHNFLILFAATLVIYFLGGLWLVLKHGVLFKDLLLTILLPLLPVDILKVVISLFVFRTLGALVHIE